MKAAVFGGTGWVGHNIVKSLASGGYDVTICSRGQKGDFDADIPSAITRLKVDKDNESEMARFAGDDYEVVIDSVPTEKSIDNVVKNFKNIKRYVHCSSTGGYTPLKFVPGDETMSFNAEFMAGWKEKEIVDAKVMRLYSEEGFPATVLRPSYITGPGLLPIDNLGGRREDFIEDVINGVTLDVANAGRALLHPVHVKDLAKAFVLAVEKPESVGQIYNICLDKAVTVNTYLELNAKTFGLKVKLHYMSVEDMLEKYAGSISENDLRFFVEHMCFDITKAKQYLGYSPSYTTEEAIIENALWAKEQIGK